MLSNRIESEKLFSKLVPVSIRDGLTNQSRSSHLFLTVEWQITSDTIHRKTIIQSPGVYFSEVLLITLTDNNDPFFLYNLHLPEGDFQMLKNDQGLLVDYSAFPQKFIDFIELCIAEENKAQPKFLFILRTGETIGNISSPCHLDVVETNQFKHLTHLSLKFLPAPESSVKKYLVVCFRNLKEERQNLQNRLCFMEKDFKDNLSKLQDMLEKKSQELEIVRKQLNVELSMTESKYARELAEERDKFSNKQRAEMERNEKERREKENDFKKQIQQLEKRASVLDTLNKEIQDKNYKQDTVIRELRAHVLSIEEENKRIKESLRNSKEQNESFQSEIRDKRLHLCHQKDKIDELEQEIHQKKQHISKMQDQLDIYHKQVKKLEQELDEAQEKLRKKERTCVNLEEDISKANDVIQKLQREIQSGHEKLKNWNKLSSKHEHSIQEKEKIIQLLRKDLSDAIIDCKNKNSELKDLSKTVTSLQEKISLLQKEIEQKNREIKFYNHQLIDNHAFGRYVPSTTPITNHPAIIESREIPSAGDPGVLRVNNSVPSNYEKSKSLPTSENNYSIPVNHADFQRKKLTPVAIGDSAYGSSPSCNSKSTNIITGDRNINQTNLEIDSQALSAAFGNNVKLKHSTAKKQTLPKSSRNTKKS